MTKLTVQPTPMAHWQELIASAANANQVKLAQEVEHYLAQTLMRFTDDQQIGHRPLAIDYLNHIHSFTSHASVQLQTVGDHCLILTGLFPGHAHRKRVRVKYYVNLGRSAYHTLGHHRHHNDSELYRLLCDQFVSLMEILQSMRDLESNVSSLSPLLAEELWHDLNSQHAKRVLQSLTQQPDFFTCSPPQKPLH